MVLVLLFCVLILDTSCGLWYRQHDHPRFSATANSI